MVYECSLCGNMRPPEDVGVYVYLPLPGSGSIATAEDPEHGSIVICVVCESTIMENHYDRTATLPLDPPEGGGPGKAA